MPNSHDNYKREHEKGACQDLLKALDFEYKFERLGNDKDEADVLFIINDKKIGIEVALAYYDEEAAIMEWKAYRKQIKGIQIHKFMVEPDKKLIDWINKELEDKAQKAYSGSDENWLCLDVRAPITLHEDIHNRMGEINVPTNQFARIYLLIFESGKIKYIRIK